MKKKILLSTLATSLLLPATTNLVFPTQVTVAQENSIKTIEIAAKEITEFGAENNFLRIVVKAYDNEGKPAGGIVYGFDILEVIKEKQEYKVKTDNGDVAIVKIVGEVSTTPEATPTPTPTPTPAPTPNPTPETTPGTKPETKPKVKPDAKPVEKTKNSDANTSRNKLTGTNAKKELPKTSAVK